MTITSTTTRAEAVTAILFASPGVFSEAFRFAELPGEIRNEIYSHYLGQWDAIVEYDRQSAKFTLRGVPDYSLVYASRAVHNECRNLIPQAYSGRLVLRDTKIRREKGFGFVSSLDVIASLCPSWLLANTSLITLEQGTTSMLMMVPWHKLNSLKQVYLEGNSLPIAYYNPCGLSARAKEAQERGVLEGKYDKWCVHGFKSWSQVPDSVACGRVRVITIRTGLVKGSSLRIQVEHRADCAEVLERCITRPGQPPLYTEIPRDDALPVKCLA